MAHLAERELLELRAVAAEGGLTQQELADRFGVSRSYVSRLLAGDRRVLLEAPESEGAIASVVDAFLADREFTPEETLLAATLRLLAGKLDMVAASDAVGTAQATPSLVRQFSETLRELQGTNVDAAQEVARSLLWLRDWRRDGQV